MRLCLPTTSPARGTRHAFTLMEVLLATGIAAIVLAGIGGVFFSAIRLRERTASALDQSLPVYHALDVLRADLRCTLPPGVTAGDFVAGLAGHSVSGQGISLQFSTTTGEAGHETVGGDVQEVIYELRPSLGRGGIRAQELVRSVNRNLLSATTGLAEPESQIVLQGVKSIEVSCFDGYDWRTVWDTTTTETNLPLAVKVRLQMELPGDLERRDVEPYELVVPLAVQMGNAATTPAEGEQEEGES